MYLQAWNFLFSERKLTIICLLNLTDNTKVIWAKAYFVQHSLSTNDDKSNYVLRKSISYHTSFFWIVRTTQLNICSFMLHFIKSHAILFSTFSLGLQKKINFAIHHAQHSVCELTVRPRLLSPIWFFKRLIRFFLQPCLNSAMLRSWMSHVFPEYIKNRHFFLYLTYMKNSLATCLPFSVFTRFLTSFDFTNSTSLYSYLSHTLQNQSCQWRWSTDWSNYYRNNRFYCSSCCRVSFYWIHGRQSDSCSLLQSRLALIIDNHQSGSVQKCSCQCC